MGELIGLVIFGLVIAVLNIVKHMNDQRMKKEQQEARERRQRGEGPPIHERARQQIYGDAIPTAKRRGGQPTRQPQPGPERQQRQQPQAAQEDTLRRQREQALKQEQARQKAHEEAIREEELRRMHEAATERHATPQNLDPRRMADRPILREAGHDVRELFDDLMGREQRREQPPQRETTRQRHAQTPQEQRRQKDLERQRQRAQKQQRGRPTRQRDRRETPQTPIERAARQGMPSIGETAMDSPGGGRKLRRVKDQRAARRIGAAGLFPDRDALRRGIVMSEVLGPPRAERELSETRNWS